MISRRFLIIIFLSAILLSMLACGDLFGGGTAPAQENQAAEGENLQATTQVLVTQMALTSQAQQQYMPPTATQQPISPPPTTTPQPAATEESETGSPAAAELIQDLSINRNTFYCIEADGPTTVTFTVEMSDIERGMAIFWRLYEKADQSMTEWKNVSMVRKTSTARTFTFDANAGEGTNNFFYPPGFAESWFQFQLISGDGQYRTPVYRDDITFFPCAQ